MKYQKTQHSIVLNIILLGTIIFVVIAHVKQLGSKPIPLLPTVILVLFLGFVWLLFYKLQIKIDAKTITATFGIGLLKKQIPLDTINLGSLEVVKPSALAGIGIRITQKGILWNVKIGKAIYFKTKDATKTFFVGTDDAESILNILKSSK